MKFVKMQTHLFCNGVQQRAFAGVQLQVDGCFTGYFSDVLGATWQLAKLARVCVEQKTANRTQQQ